ncbi:hypothetical protein J6590_051156 [Homalodisca vitripennis]|nr:hypothetical protein J6590_051156 [Homalodisca vitripennis]
MWECDVFTTGPEPCWPSARKQGTHLPAARLHHSTRLLIVTARRGGRCATQSATRRPPAISVPQGRVFYQYRLAAGHLPANTGFMSQFCFHVPGRRVRMIRVNELPLAHVQRRLIHAYS